MTIAVMMDFSGASLSVRDGIFVYLYYLLKALLKYNADLNIEVWVYSHSYNEAKEYLFELLNVYGERISICTDQPVISKKRHKVMICKIEKKICFYLQKLLWNEKFAKIQMILINRHDIYSRRICELSYDMVEAFDKNSQADCCYVPFVNLQTATKLKKPVVVQVHDLFTFQLYDLFMKQSNPPALFWKYNRRIAKILNAYAKSKSIFVSSSSYTVKQLIKYISLVEKEYCKIISFPPLITMFDADKIYSREEFFEKYSINYAYIAFPSQNRPNKNLILLLKALEVVNCRGIRIKLITTGKLCDVVDTNQFRANHDDLVFEIGSLTKQDLYCLYKYSAMVVCPNLIEGMNISGQCLEALAIGEVPVIHVKSLGIEESLKSVGLNFETADLNWVDWDDYITLADKIIEVYRCPQESVEKQRNIIEAYQKKTWESVAHDFMDIFETYSDI